MPASVPTPGRRGRGGAGPGRIPSGGVRHHDPGAGPDTTRRDLLRWSLLVVAGLLLTWVAVRVGARLGSAAPPFLGAYRLRVNPTSLLAPAVAAIVLTLARSALIDRMPWPAVLGTGYLGALTWAVALAVVDGAAGLTRGLTAAARQAAGVGDDPIGYLRWSTAAQIDAAPDLAGHPPATVLALWTLHRAGLTDPVAVGLLVTAIGALVVPLTLAAVRGTCGEPAARRYLPVLALAPWAVWLAVSTDALVAALTAAVLVAGVRASDHRRTGAPAATWAAVAGLLLGTAAMFSYAAPWLGLSVGGLYFARRRAMLNLVTAGAALLPVAVAQSLGFGWVDGLLAAQRDFAGRVEPYRSALWWAAISAVALLLAAGPAIVSSLRKVRNTPGWPFLVGAGAAVLFTVLAGLARGGVEHAWLAFLPWLTVAAVAPERPGGPPVRVPLLTALAGAVTAVVVQAVLLSPW